MSRMTPKQTRKLMEHVKNMLPKTKVTEYYGMNPKDDDDLEQDDDVHDKGSDEDEPTFDPDDYKDSYYPNDSLDGRDDTSHDADDDGDMYGNDDGRDEFHDEPDMLEGTLLYGLSQIQSKIDDFIRKYNLDYTPPKSQNGETFWQLTKSHDKTKVVYINLNKAGDIIMSNQFGSQTRPAQNFAQFKHADEAGWKNAEKEIATFFSSGDKIQETRKLMNKTFAILSIKR